MYSQSAGPVNGDKLEQACIVGNRWRHGWLVDSLRPTRTEDQGREGRDTEHSEEYDLLFREPD